MSQRLQVSDNTLKAVGITAATFIAVYTLYSTVVPKNPFAYLPKSIYDPLGSYIYDAKDRDNDIYQEYPALERISTSGQGALLVNDPNLAHQVLLRVDRYKKGHLYRRSDNIRLFHNLLIGGASVANTTGEDWRVRREVLVPLFQSRAIMPELLPYLIRRTEALIEEIKSYKGEPIEMDKLFVRLTADVICEYIFGECPDYDEVKFDNLNNPVRKVATMKLRHFLKLFGIRDPGTAEIEQNSRFVRRTIHKIKRGEGMRTNGAPTVVEQLLEFEQYQGPEGEDRLEQELLILIFAGHDTTAHSLNMLTYMLTQKPECQEKIREELDSIIPDTESMTAANLGKLQYTSAVIKEGLRLHPIVGTITVVSVEDTVLADVQIPKGSTILLPVTRIQRDPTIFKKPLDFLPERWLEENLELQQDLENVGNDKSKLSRAFMAFSQGTHSCLGMNLAYLELRVVTALLVKNFELKHTGPIPEINGVLLRLKENPRIEFQPLKSA